MNFTQLLIVPTFKEKNTICRKCTIFLQRSLSAAMRGVIAVLAFITSIRAGIEAHNPLPCAPCSSRIVKCNCNYVVKGSEIIMNVQDTNNLLLNCNKQDVLSVDNTELPKAQKLLEIKTVTIKNCKVPLNGSYHDALKAMNFTMSKNSKLYLILPANPQLLSHHLCDLTISALHIEAKDHHNPPRPASDYLKYISGLRSLKLQNVIPEVGESLPLAIENLHLEYTHLAERTNGSAWLERLQSLRVFYLQENIYLTKVLFALPKLYLLPKLKKITLVEVPLDLISLAGSLNGSSVTELTLESCGINNLSSEMFAGANLTALQLTDCKLNVPESVLSGLQWLTKLDVSNSGLDGEALLRMVLPLKRLKTLTAKNNPLGSLCGDADDISANSLPNSLHKLDLRDTGATRICPDWIKKEELMDINLSTNDIGNITLRQLAIKRKVPGKVRLSLIGNPKLRMTGVSSADMELFFNETSYSEVSSNNLTRARVTVKLKNLICDCDSRYWLHKALRSPLLKIDHFKGCISDTANNDSAAIISVPDKPEEILCQYSGGCLPNCSCWRQPSDNRIVVQCAALPSELWLSSTSYGDNTSLVLHVGPGVMSYVPTLPLIELYAPNNNITGLDVEHIPETLRVLDVRNNSIQHISEETAQRLKDNGANVTLAGNRLACACYDASAFELLQFLVHDWNETQCADNSFVTEKMEDGLCKFPTLPVLLSVSCLLVMLIVGFLLDKYKSQIRKILFKLNLCRRYIFKVNDKADSDKTVDAFLSYALPDLKILDDLKAGLESRGYTTLEHCRDWQPGLPIKEQITSSVMSARRTILLVSDHYAKSKWALEEFLTAHAHAMERQTARVLIVRYNLNEPNKLPSDLQIYLKYNTYLDWHHEKFWAKLCQYMPLK